MRTCPLCGKEYSEPPAISRVDDCTEICSRCGSKQSLEACGMFTAEQIEKILEEMYSGRS